MEVIIFRWVGTRPTNAMNMSIDRSVYHRCHPKSSSIALNFSLSFQDVALFTITIGGGSIITIS